LIASDYLENNMDLMDILIVGWEIVGLIFWLLNHFCPTKLWNQYGALFCLTK
jgi:hypothetical protein